MANGKEDVWKNWNANYPVSSASDLFKAERAYTAAYERKHGKVGQTFSRCEKVRIQATYLGQYRPLTDDRWSVAFYTALHFTGFTETIARRADIFRREGLFRAGNELVWMPIQEPVIPYLQKEALKGQDVTLYTVLVSHHDYYGTLHLSFLVNEFRSNKTPQTGSPSMSTESEGTTAQTKTTTSCGFTWVDWNTVSSADKAAMKSVMVPDYDGGFTGSLLQ